MADPVPLKVRCPLCGDEHVYPVVVERSVTLGMLEKGRRPPTVERQFVRLVVCPRTSNRFQTTLRLSETAAGRIRAVTVRESEEAPRE